ncbi:MAG: hypothetical protein ACYCYR_08375 [Desulfobulbaceae bacterium]
MVASGTAENPQTPKPVDWAARLHLSTVVLLLLVMAAELVFVLSEGQWINVFLILSIMGLALAPIVFRRKLPVDVPPEFLLLAVVFAFAALFLGEVRSYYERIWWWDIALHGSSGLLLGIFGFLLVFVLNENERIDLHMRPRFVALFAFLFAVAVGALWEIFEFAMDQLFSTQMQKPMLGDPSGLTDTMWDLILDSLGGLIISALGWWHMAREERSFIDRWIRRFIERNPSLFHA